jgi:hypothetical protein
MKSESGIEWTPALRNLETEIFKGKRERRIDNIKMAWGVYLKTLEKKSFWEWIKEFWG